MEITIIGSGAIGGVLGAYIVKAGVNIVFCDIEQDHVNHIRYKGLRIEGPAEEFVVKGEAYTPEELIARNKQLDWVFICTKAHHAQQALDQVHQLINKDTTIVSFQNGLIDLKVPKYKKVSEPLCCFVNFSADYLEPGRILYGGVSSVAIGEFNGASTDRLKELKKILEHWGPVKETNNIKGYLWSKLSYAALLYATALVDETMANVVERKEFRPALIELCAEVLEAAHIKSVNVISFDVWKPELIYPRDNQNTDLLNEEFDRISFWMSQNKKQKSGIWRDIAIRRRKTEVDFDLVPILEIGKQHNLSFPLTKFVIERIKELEKGAKQMSWDNLMDLKKVYEDDVLSK
ncbi:2-dehydropantoate 2-reductase [Bacillus sp. ISL-55]|uniref:ketopantoate reductase family protein n=1 Tax=Bacillus sp. ISL-55 TaxID=2819134 RepID=UPI001BE5B027|nr:2-dehydropantoate 2-reductase [Bacillus sp. ISL-55]MBT2692075.1 2-dehydropantoate 2-reductase [Bacillus sp. ISL-55]